MKKGMKKVLSLFYVMAMSITLAGCSLKSNKNDKSTIEVDNYVEKYYVNQYFLVSGTKLVVKNSKNKVLEEIVVTEDMIKRMPDMTTAGEKEIIVVYKDKEYSYKILVENRPVNELVLKLEDFLNKYENKNDYTLEASYDMDLLANYFGEEVAIDNSQAMVLFGQLFAGDELTNAGYSALFNAIMNGSFDISDEDVVDSNNFKVKLDLLKILNEMKNEFNDFDYKTYIFEKAFGENDAKNIDSVASTISQFFMVKSVIGKSSIKTIVSKYYYKLKAFESFDVGEAVREVLNKVKLYTESPNVKQMLDVVDTLQNEELIHFTSSLMEDYWTNYAKVMTLEEYGKDSWEYGYEPTFLNNVNSRLLLSKYIKAQKDYVYSIEEALVGFTSIRSLDDIKDEAVNVLKALEKYMGALEETTRIQRDNSWVIVIDDGYEYTDAVIGGSYVYMDKSFVPNYDSDIDTYKELKADFGDIRYYLETHTIIELIKDQNVVENFVELYFEDYSRNEKDVLINSVYGLLENDVTLKEAYVSIIDVLLTEENNFYVDGLSESFSYFFLVENETGKQKIKQIIEGIFSDIVNAERFDVVKSYKDLLECVNTYTSDQQVKNLTDALDELTYDEMIHFTSNVVGKHFNSFAKVMTVAEHEKDYFESNYEPTYVTNQKAKDLLDDTVKMFENHILSIENFIEAVSKVRDVNSLKEEMKTLLLSLSNSMDLMKESVEIQKENGWVVVLEDGYGHSSALVAGSYGTSCDNSDCIEEFTPYYDDSIETYDYYGSLFEKAYEYIDHYSFVDVIQENELVEMLVEKYMDGYTNSEKNKIIDLLYDVLNNDASVDEIKETLESVFVTNKNQVIEQLIEYFEVYANEGVNSLIDLFVNQYTNEITGALVGAAEDLIYNEELIEDVESLIRDVINGYVDGNLNLNDVVDCIKDMIDTYSDRETVVAFSLATIMYHVFNYDENTNYNELFGDYVELPNQIDNIDYNELMKKLVNESTYDAFKLNEVEIDYVVDSQDNIVGEVLKVKMDVDFDVLMVSLKGDIELVIKIDFTSEGK